MGPGRTGVKGVLRDRDEAEELERAKRAKEMEQVRRKMERGNLGGKTFLEEERQKGPDEKVDELVQKEREWEKELLTKRDVFGGLRQAKFGHLREVGVQGYVSAVENEDKGVWVIVHLYDGSLDRCYLLDDTLTHLARLYPDTKFLRCRAAALGFTSTGPSKFPRSKISRPARPKHRDSDEDDYNEKDDTTDEDDDVSNEDDIDLDMLPTMLVYRDGELVHNWVRVDWEAGQSGIQELLQKYHILPERESFFNTLGIHSDGEDADDDDGDLIWGDSDDET